MEFAKTTPSPSPKTSNIRMISMLAAAFFTVLAVAQLFTFEQFHEVLAGYYSALIDDSAATVLAACIVTFEVAAIPFLLAMPLSLAARITSMVAGWISVGIWTALSTVSLAAGGEYTALFGATIDLPAGWWTLCFCVALGILVAWITWGMWPVTAKRRR